MWYAKINRNIFTMKRQGLGIFSETPGSMKHAPHENIGARSHLYSRKEMLIDVLSLVHINIERDNLLDLL